MAMNRFEHLVHTRRRDEGELSVDRINEAWVESQGELFGDSVEITEGYRMWWSYVPHFINTPGYVYAYAYGQLLALSVYGRYLRGGRGLRPRYLELLAAGGSRTPEELGAIVGIDLADPGLLGRRAWPGRAAAARRRGAGRSSAEAAASTSPSAAECASASWRAACASALPGARPRWRSA